MIAVFGTSVGLPGTWWPFKSANFIRPESSLVVKNDSGTTSGRMKPLSAWERSAVFIERSPTPLRTVPKVRLSAI